MREDLRRNLLAQKVVEKEVVEKIDVTDADITAFFEANKASFNRAEDAVHIAQIVVTPVREPQRTNRTGDDAATPQEATAKAQMLMQKLKGGTAFGDLAADYSEDGESAQRGGDLGFVPMSALAPGAPGSCATRCFKSAPGTVQLVSQGGAHTIVLTVARDTEGQKDLSMPSVKEAISHDAEGPQGAVDARGLPDRAAQRREGREHPREEGARDQGQDAVRRAGGTAASRNVRRARAASDEDRQRRIRRREDTFSPAPLQHPLHRALIERQRVVVHIQPDVALR